MITPEMLHVIIVSFCSFKDPKVSRDYKESCMEQVLNCSVIGDTDGHEIPENKVKACKEKWINYVKR